MGKPVKLTPAQLWILECAAQGHRVVSAGGYEVYTCMRTGEVHCGAPHAAHKVCTARGWLANDRITDAGRAAVKEEAGRK